MVTIIDYGMCNLGSVVSMFRKVGIATRTTDSPAEVASATRIVLPGVGQFDRGVRGLQSRRLWDALDLVARSGEVPILGICLGMQLLFESSEEGQLAGFGWVAGKVRRFDTHEVCPALKIPHMGWNHISLVRDSLIWRGLPPDPRFYFVHAFYCDPVNAESITGECEYGRKFCAAIQVGSIYGVQFHPEKSHSFGMKILRNFGGD